MTDMPPEQLEQLVRETRELSEDNNRLLRLIRRDALIGTIAKIVLWLLILGVPLFFLSTYLAPLIGAVSGTGSEEGLKPGLFGLPSQEQMDALLRAYQGE